GWANTPGGCRAILQNHAQGIVSGKLFVRFLKAFGANHKTIEACTEHFSIQTAVVDRLWRVSQLNAKCGSVESFDWQARRMQVRVISTSRQIVRNRRAALGQAMSLSILGVVPLGKRQRGFTLIELLVVI